MLEIILNKIFAYESLDNLCTLNDLLDLLLGELDVCPGVAVEGLALMLVNDGVCPTSKNLGSGTSLVKDDNLPGSALLQEALSTGGLLVVEVLAVDTTGHSD